MHDLKYFYNVALKAVLPKNPSKQRVDLLHVELELRDLNNKTPAYEDCILKYRESNHKIYFSVDKSCNFRVILKINNS